MNARIEKLLAECERSRGASPEAISKAIELLGVPLPGDYLDLIAATNGVEGVVGEGYLALYNIEWLPEANSDTPYREYAAGVVIFAGDGGAKRFVLIQVSLHQYISRPRWALGTKRI